MAKVFLAAEQAKQWVAACQSPYHAMTLFHATGIPFLKEYGIAATAIKANNWILSVEALETGINKVIVSHRTQEIEKFCCGGYCSKNYRSSYKYGKKVARKLVEVEALKSNGVFEEVAAESLPTALVDVIPNEPTVGMGPIFD
ncbi:unnamed protein product [Prunus armeniaca]